MNSTSPDEKYGSSEISTLEEKRAYEWVDDKLDCSQPGSGCKVPSSSADAQDQFVDQVLELINIGNNDLDNYFLNNDLSTEFPNLYNDDFLGKLVSGERNLNFEFPYLFINNDQDELVEVYNYESTLSDNNVLAQLQIASYSKEVAFSDDEGTVWECLQSGNNCKVSSVSFHAQWLASNPSYTFAPNIEDIDDIEISQDGNSNRILITSSSNEYYGVEF
ncbi:hypothetical protein [Salibacter sp.]|uniref:hypothetical protein n=1 Tax=Salibacter sp. TaxID=2010995 RepID=UPI00286FCAF7|nr:hypothetical protein [Salibacter sp.]MDR9399714.1 hypothetical protein [Salibacter sp.]MDR9487740.1 hypothetical protein [Salibacter sp.]